MPSKRRSAPARKSPVLRTQRSYATPPVRSSSQPKQLRELSKVSREPSLAFTFLTTITLGSGLLALGGFLAFRIFDGPAVEVILTLVSLAIAALAGVASNYIAKGINSVSGDKRILLSYDLVDVDVAREIKSNLERSGQFRIWDPETDLHPGDNIADNINSALDNTDFVIFITSSDSHQLEQVPQAVISRLESDRSLKVSIIPVTSNIKSLPRFLRDYRVIDLGRGVTSAIDELASTLSIR